MNENIQKFEQFLGERGRNQFVILLNLFVLVLILYFGVSALKLGHTRPAGELPRQLAVAGEGKTTVKPDVAVFTASVVTQAAKVKDAQAENTRKSNTIVDFLKKQGVDEKDIKTTEYNIYPQYSSSYPPLPCVFPGPCPVTTVRPPEITSYQVRQTIQIKVRDLAKADDLLSGVVSAGTNEVGSLTFKVDDPEVARAAARKKAIDNAMVKAQTLANDLGVRLKKIVAYTDESANYPQPYMVNGLGARMEASPAAPGPQVQPGEQEVTANVTIVYEFR